MNSAKSSQTPLAQTASQLAPIFQALGEAQSTRRRTYEFSSPGCETGFRVAYGLEEYCQNLQLAFQNQYTSCSEEKRRKLFDEHCHSHKWDPKEADQSLRGRGTPHFLCRLFDRSVKEGESIAQVSSSGFLELGLHNGTRLFATLELSKADPRSGKVESKFEVEVVSRDGFRIDGRVENWTQLNEGGVHTFLGDEANPIAQCLVRAMK